MPKRILTGIICKSTNKKTVVVEVERTFKHPIYKNLYNKKTHFLIILTTKIHQSVKSIKKDTLRSYKIQFKP